MSDRAPAAPVSVIIPCYRCSATLERAVASVAAQSEVPAEVILVDDCSGDDTRSTLQTIASQYPPGWVRMVLLDQNMGAASARNAGWAVATQTYIAFLDSDDAWHPDKVRLQLRYMLSHPDVVLCGHAHKILPTDAVPVWPLRDAGAAVKARRVTKWDLLISNRFVTPSAMLRRDIPQRFEERQRYMEDHMLWLNVVCSGARVDRIALPLAAIYKRSYGQAGLSAQWWLMERGDLGNYRRLMVRQYISRFEFLAFAAFSGAKFLRRVVLYNLFAAKPK
jgi:glycosyltransferase involved in cell wall biosynthesis